MQSFLLVVALSFETFSPAANTQNLSRKVTFVSPATRVEMLMPDLAKATGMSLLFSAQVKDEVLIVSVRDVPMNVLMDKMATAASAEWQKEGESYRLIRSAKLLQKLEQESLEKLAQSVAKGQERLTKSLDGAGEYSDSFARSVSERLSNYISQLTPRGDMDYRKLDGMRLVLPGYRLALRIAISLDPKMLATIPARERAVFSTKPNHLQKAFPKSLQPAISIYLKEAEMLAAHLSDEPKMPEFGVEANIWRALNLRSNKARIPAKILAIVGSPATSGSSTFQLIVANEKGGIIDQSHVSLSPTDPASRPTAPIPPPPDASEKIIELSPLAKEYAEYVRTARQPSTAGLPPLSTELREFIVNPERHETTALVFSDVVLAATKEKKLNVVISPSYGAMGPGSGKDMTPSKFLFQYMTSPFGGAVVSLANGWLEAKPADWFRVRTSVPDRAALGRLLRTGLKRPLNLEDLSTTALAMTSANAYYIGLAVYDLVFRDARDQLRNNDYELLRLHASLTPPQRRTAMAEGLTFSSLTPWQKSQVETMIYGEERFQMDWEYRGNSEEPEGPHAHISFQPTERYANGIPPNALLTIGDDSKRKIMCYADPFTMEAQETHIAGLLLAKERPEIRLSGSERTWNEFSVMEQTGYRYMLRTEPRLTHRGQLQFVLSATKRVDSIDKLPADVLSKVNAELVKLREQYKNYKPPH